MGRASLRGLALLSALPLLAAPATAQDQIVVDVAVAVTDVSRRPIGINMNFLVDDDNNRDEAVRRLADALKQAGVKYLRYPGGEKADGYLWSVQSFTSSRPTLARWATGEWPQNQEWPSYDRSLVNPDGHTFRTDPLTFDEFMAVCQEIDCEPTIVVAYDSMYKPAQPGGVAPTRSQLVQTAREWVRYANLVRGYGVKYWEIGNETWQRHYNGGATAADYARDLVEFSRVMKAVDPTIRIGANGESMEWWRTVLSAAARSIDFLAVHNYPAYDWRSYSHYRDNEVTLTGPVDVARNAIAAYAPAADRARLEIAVTEAGPADWTAAWPHRNDMGHALVLFDLIGMHLLHPAVAFTQLWNTRWTDNQAVTTPSVFDALDKHNNLQATGQVMAIWGQFLNETMVASTGTRMVRAYSSFSSTNGALAIFLVNKDTAARGATVRIEHWSSSLSIERWVFGGTGPDDLYPAWIHRGGVPSSGNSVTVALDPVSVTVLDVRPATSAATSLPGALQAEDFDTFLDWTPANHGGQYRPTSVDIERSADAGGGYNVGWFDRGEWLEYAVQAQSGGSYRLSARVASPSDAGTLRWMVDGAVVATTDVPNTGGWQTWQTIQSLPVFISAGPHRLRITTDTGSFNVNWIAATYATASTPSITLEAEDFETFLDWTSANNGGQYRSTAVDIERTLDSDGGYNVGWFERGEWLDYVLRIETSGTYQISARVASPFSWASLNVTIDGSPVGDMSVPNTGGWQAWRTASLPAVHLPAGTHRLRVSTPTGGLNLNRLTVSLR